MAKGVAKNNDGLMIKSFDIDNGEVTFTTDVKEAYRGEWNAKTELEFLVHHLKKEHQELETMEYTVVPC